ncbi:signal peptidase II [Candidatus Magnetaquicoccus inordinatus]|uniref:signal peptidase II n=1 Tax=Candidatus Magnetaquicoccus inordinatus TaxID=2496818 RepID=UPI00102BE382|nr:signal peptidase II [Candidatus Magnetaquicoccus inordinatus]
MDSLQASPETNTASPPAALSPSRKGVGLLSAVLLLAADQLSKELASTHLATQEWSLLPGFADLTLAHNLGAAFSLFADLPPTWRSLLLVGVASLAILFLLVLLWQSKQRQESIALGLILGGAAGNLLDRLRLGYVVDFIHLHWHDLSWPIFNLADVAIDLGVALLLWDSFRKTGTPSP